jgi:hypothetical protein
MAIIHVWGLKDLHVQYRVEFKTQERVHNGEERDTRMHRQKQKCMGTLHGIRVKW